MLDRAETKDFIDKIIKHMAPERARNYHPEEFDQLFDKYDEDKNGFIEKSEMAVFIKQVFKNKV